MVRPSSARLSLGKRPTVIWMSASCLRVKRLPQKGGRFEILDQRVHASRSPRPYLGKPAGICQVLPGGISVSCNPFQAKGRMGRGRKLDNSPPPLYAIAFRPRPVAPLVPLRALPMPTNRLRSSCISQSWTRAQPRHIPSCRVVSATLFVPRLELHTPLHRLPRPFRIGGSPPGCPPLPFAGRWSARIYSTSEWNSLPPCLAPR